MGWGFVRHGAETTFQDSCSTSKWNDAYSLTRSLSAGERILPTDHSRLDDICSFLEEILELVG